MGISGSDIPAIISRTPTLLSRSIEKNLVPGYNFLKNVFCNDKDVVRSVKRDSNILVRVVGGPVALNVDVLRGAGVPQSRISFMLLHFPYTAYQNPDKIRKCVEDAIKMGFDPLTLVFIDAVHVKCGISKDTWDHRMEVYRKWGLSDEDILLAFRKHPLCMRLSDDKIRRTMDFLVNKMSWKPAIIARNPVVLFYDLEKRIIPRCSVIKVLMSRGLIKKDLGLSSFMMPAEKRFLDRFVRNYYKDIPELIKIYLGDGHLEPEYGSEDSAAMNCLQFNLQN